MKEGNSKRMNLNIQMYYDIFLNEVLEYTTVNRTMNVTSCMHIRRKSKRRSKVFRRISSNSYKHLNSFHIYNPFAEMTSI